MKLGRPFGSVFLEEKPFDERKQGLFEHSGKILSET
jgi:hypothetical protein